MVLWAKVSLLLVIGIPTLLTVLHSKAELVAEQHREATDLACSLQTRLYPAQSMKRKSVANLGSLCRDRGGGVETD